MALLVLRHRMVYLARLVNCDWKGCGRRQSWEGQIWRLT